MTAAWVDQLTLAEIAAEMNKSLDFLTLTEHDVPERQRSLRAVFAWSWRLLSPAEQRILCRLAIFRGGFSRAAAEQITGAALRELSTLVHKSLIQYRTNDRDATTEQVSTQSTTIQPTSIQSISAVAASPTGRYELHELLRQFAFEQLVADTGNPDQQPQHHGDQAAPGTVQSEYQEVARRHSAYYLTLLAEYERPIARAASRAATAAIQIEVDNVRQAWSWAAQAGDYRLLDGAAYTLWQFCKYAGLWAEGVTFYQQAIDCLRQAGDKGAVSNLSAMPATSSVLSKMLALQGSCLISLSRHEQAMGVAQQAITIGLSVGEETQSVQGIALGYLVHGQALRRTGDTAQARPLIERAVALAKAYQTAEGLLELLPEIEMRAYGWLCSIALSPDHDYVAAQHFAEANLHLCRRLGKLDGEMVAITDIIDVATASDDLATARRYNEQVLPMAQQLGHQRVAAMSRRALADIVRRQGEYLLAYHLAETALQEFQQLDDLLQQVVVLGRLGLLSTLLGAYNQAQSYFDQLTVVRQSVESALVEICDATIAFARFELYQGHYAAALHHADQAQAMAQQLQAPINQIQAALLRGHAYAAQQQWAAAGTAYEQALVYARMLGTAPLYAEPQAGLAQVALAQGQLTTAQTYVEAICATLTAYPQASFDEPFLIYLICYQVLAATGAASAERMLQSGYDLLQSYAGNITEGRLQHSFLNAVPTHAALAQAYHAKQASRVPDSKP